MSLDAIGKRHRQVFPAKAFLIYYRLSIKFNPVPADR